MRVDLRALAANASRRRPRRPTLRSRDMPSAVVIAVEGVFSAIARAWAQEIRVRILPQYQRQSLTADGQPEARAAIGMSAEEVSRVLVYQTERLGRWVTRVGEWHGREFVNATRSAVGVDVSPYVLLSEIQSKLEDSLREGVGRLRSLDSETRRRVEAMVFRAFADRWTKKRLVDELAAMTESTKKRARLRARDFASTIQSVLDEYRYTQFGLDSYVWRTMGDERVRSLHEVREGRVYAWSTPPHDGHAGRPPGCRCRPEALLWT